MVKNDIFNVTLNDKDKKIELLFQYFRKNGFPNYNIKDYNSHKELLKVINFDDNKILDGDKIKQVMNGCGFLWTYFPHWIEIPCGNDTALIDNWNDDDKLRALIRKTYDWQLKHGNGKFTINRIRQNAKVYCSKQSVSNFRPTVAKYIYNTYGNKGVVFDMCSGFGGRLLGFLASNCKKYIGCEPSTKTYEGLIQLKNDFSYVDKKVEIHKLGCEDIILEPNSVDLCFTSPPYFDTEKYSNEETQSYIKYPNKTEWLEGFLYTMFYKCFKILKDNGYLILNIANVKTFIDLEQEAIKGAYLAGFELVDTKYLILSSIAGKGVKKEPIFIFKKVLNR